MSKTKRRILIAVNEKTFGDDLASELKKELREYNFDVVTNCEDAKRLLYPESIKTAKSKVQWLIIQEDLADHAEGSSAPNQKHPGIELAKGWRDHSAGSIAKSNSSNANRRGANHDTKCIALTQSFWASRPMPFGKRLLGAHWHGRTDELAVHLADMIDAGNADQCYIEPLILELELRRPSIDSEFWTLSFRRNTDFGPHALSTTNLPATEFKLQNRDFSMLGPKADTAAIKTYEAFNNVANPFGAELFDETGSIGKELQRIHTRITKLCWEDNVAPPPFLHLHVHCQQDALGLPLDVAILPEGGDAHVASMFPVVWHMTVANDHSEHPGANMIRVHHEPDRGTPKRYFQNSIGHFAAATSCGKRTTVTAELEFDPIRDNVNHLKRVSKPLRWKKVRPQELANRDELKKFLRSGPDGCRRRRYVLTHGEVHKTLPSYSCFVIGNELITVNDLRKILQNKRLSFIFANCCDLAHQADKRVSQGDYFGGFIAGAITTGIVTEAIGNRWSVTVTEAQLLAEQFYQSHPRTVHSRATALFHARNLVRDASEQTNLSWLAPVHVIRQKPNNIFFV